MRDLIMNVFSSADLSWNMTWQIHMGLRAAIQLEACKHLASAQPIINVIGSWQLVRPRCYQSGLGRAPSLSVCRVNI